PLVHPAYVPLPPTSPRTCPLVPYTTLFRSANAHAQLFVKAGLERLYESMDQIRTFLQTKLGELQIRMQEAETKLMKFQAAHNLLPINIQKDVASERLMDLSKRLTDAQGQLFALEAEYHIVERGNYDSLPAVLHSPLIQNLREN